MNIPIDLSGWVRTDPDIIVRLERLERKLDWLHSRDQNETAGNPHWPGDLAPSVPIGIGAVLLTVLDGNNKLVQASWPLKMLPYHYALGPVHLDNLIVEMSGTPLGETRP